MPARLGRPAPLKCGSLLPLCDVVRSSQTMRMAPLCQPQKRRPWLPKRVEAIPPASWHLCVRFLHCLKQPLVQCRQKRWLHIAKCQAHPKIRLRICNTRISLEKVRVGEDFHENMRTGWKGIGHVKVAAIQAEITNADKDPGARGNFHNLCCSHKGIPRGTPTVRYRTIAPRICSSQDCTSMA